MRLQHLQREPDFANQVQLLSNLFVCYRKLCESKKSVVGRSFGLKTQYVGPYSFTFRY
jgi:hypothetical protein